jgi:hypothetical protein
MTEELTSGGIEGKDYIVCRSCGGRFRQILPQHLKGCMPGTEAVDGRDLILFYKATYPDAPTSCEQTEAGHAANARRNIPREIGDPARERGLGTPRTFSEQAIEVIRGAVSRAKQAVTTEVLKEMHAEGYLSVGELSGRLNISEQTLFSALQTGRLAGKKFQGMWGSSEDAVGEAIQSGRMKVR